MCVVRHTNNIVWIHEDSIIILANIIYGDWIDVMNDDSAMYIVFTVIYAQITTMIADYDFVSELSPFCRAIEPLILVSITTKGDIPDDIVEFKILEAIFKGWNLYQFLITTDQLTHCKTAWQRSHLHTALLLAPPT